MDAEFLTASAYTKFLQSREFAVVLFVAPNWDKRGFEMLLPAYSQAKRALGDRVNFGIVDVDRELDLAKSIPIGSVPSVAYYRNGVALAVLIGISQNIEGRALRVMAAQPIGYKDGLQ